MNTNDRIVSINPTSHGFGFAVFEDEATLVDWGHAHVRPAAHSKCMERMAELLSWYSPQVLIVEDTQDKLSRRGERVKALIQDIASFADRSRLKVVQIPTTLVNTTFSLSGYINKMDIAQIIATHYPELKFQVPPPRRLWMSEDERMSIFSAVALALSLIHGPSCLDDINLSVE